MNEICLLCTHVSYWFWYVIAVFLGKNTCAAQQPINESSHLWRNSTRFSPWVYSDLVCALAAVEKWARAELPSLNGFPSEKGTPCPYKDTISLQLLSHRAASWDNSSTKNNQNWFKKGPPLRLKSQQITYHYICTINARHPTDKFPDKIWPLI